MSYFLDLKNKKGYTIYDVKSSDYFDLTSVLLSPFFCSTHSFYFIFAALFKCCIFFAVLRLDNLHLKWYNIIVGRQCRYSIAVITPVSQTGDAGSTPVICSTKAPVFTGAFLFRVNCRRPKWQNGNSLIAKQLYFGIKIIEKGCVLRNRVCDGRHSPIFLFRNLFSFKHQGYRTGEYKLYYLWLRLLKE